MDPYGLLGTTGAHFIMAWPAWTGGRWHSRCGELAGSKVRARRPPEGGVLGVVTYHNPACGTSRNALDLIRNASVEPHVIECPKTPPTQALVKLLE